MFCPRCSQPQTSDDTRFCARCGLDLNAVAEAVKSAALAPSSTRRGEWLLPPQKDLSTGAALMFVGAVVAVLWGFTGARGPADAMLPQAYFIMGGTLAFLLTLFHPLFRSLERLFSGETAAPSRSARRRDGINLGALLMFVGALKATLLTSLKPLSPERGLTTLAIMAGMLLLILLLRPILRGVHALFFKNVADAEESATDITRLDSKEPASALPPARDIPVNAYTRPRADTAELVTPPSVAEETTRKLKDL